MKTVAVSGAFDDLRCRHFRFLHEASRRGPVTVHLWSDALAAARLGHPVKFPFEERRYVLEAVRFVARVARTDALPGPHALPPDARADLWVVPPWDAAPEKEAFCRARGIAYDPVAELELAGYPDVPAGDAPAGGRKKVIVTGCYDWFHSGHVRFFEEVAARGELHVVVGSDENVRLLKGEGHPLFPEAERRYIASCIRHVTGAHVSTGQGWLDAEPEIRRLRPDIYAVNEDGDKPEKRQYCEAHGLEYHVLKRTPKEGLPRRQSTTLRGF